MFCFPDSVPKPPHVYVKGIKADLEDAAADSVFVRMDVQSFYPSIDHDILYDLLETGHADSRTMKLVQSALTTKTGDKRQSPPTKGVPQGLSVSNILSSIYFSHVDAELKHELNYRRYVDDILVISPKEMANTTFQELCDLIENKLKLNIHPLNEDVLGKSAIRSIDQGVDYLGFNISDTSIMVRAKSYRRMFDAIIRVFARKEHENSIEALLWKLNLRISGCRFEQRSIGWMFFFRQTEHMGQLHRLDNFVRKQMTLAGLKTELGKVKSFVKAYREIRYNRDETSYIPDFDHFSLADMVKAVALLKGINQREVATWERRKIEEEFFSMIKRQTAQMEKETVDFGDGYY